VAANLATSSEYEAEANRLRVRIGVTMGALRSGLTPSNLASEAASRVGIADLSWGGAFDYASKRHPVPTDHRVGRRTVDDVGSPKSGKARPRCRSDRTFKRIVGIYSRVRERVFRERAEAKRREFVDVAQAEVATGAAMLSDEIETRLENVIDRAPGGIKVSTARRIVNSGCASGCA
jgi:hypothetical protein